jgi:hypothetical protein
MAHATDEQLLEIAAHPGEPVPVQDSAGQVIAYLVTASALDNLQTLRTLVAEADTSADVPAEVAHDRIRRFAAAADRKHA